MKEAVEIVRAYGMSIGWAGGAGDAVSEVLHRLEAADPQPDSQPPTGLLIMNQPRALADAMRAAFALSGRRDPFGDPALWETFAELTITKLRQYERAATAIPNPDPLTIVGREP